MARAIIIGGGISGLTAAYRLQQLARERKFPLSITLIDAQSRLGGVIETRRRDGLLLESGPDAFLSEKPWGVELCRELGLEREIIGTQPESRRSFVVRDGRLEPVPAGWYLIAPGKLSTLFFSRTVSWGCKLRMACEPFIPPRRDASDESVGSFIRRRFGQEALDRIGQPMIGGIYTADPDQLSLKAAMPQLREMETRHGSVIRALQARAREKAATAQQASGARYQLFVTLASGLGRLIEALKDALSGAEFRTGCAVERIEYGPAWRVTLKGGEVLTADALCMAAPAPAAAPLLAPVSASLSDLLKGIPYESVATVNLAYRRADVPRPLDGFGVVIPAAEKRTLVGLTFAGNKFAGRAGADTVLIRAFVGGAFHRECLRQDDAGLEKMVRSELADLFGIRAEPQHVAIARYAQAMPQYRVGHLERVAAIEAAAERHPGLFLTGNAYRGIGVPDCVRQSNEAAKRMMDFLGAQAGAAHGV